MDTRLVITWFVAVGLLVYAYRGYPLLLHWIDRFRWRPLSLPQKGTPVNSVDIVFSAYNEEVSIPAKIANLKRLRSPVPVRVLMISDGSSDRTVLLARQHAAANFEILDLPVNVGKQAALNAVFPKLTGDVVLYTDANTILPEDCIERLLAVLENPNIGAVGGRFSLSNDANTRMGAYFDEETRIKTMEARIHSSIGLNGSCMAIRREFLNIMPTSVANDLYLPLGVIARGARVAFEPRVVATEELRTLRARDEAKKRYRTALGGIDAVIRYRELLNPLRYPLVSWMIISHKLLRWLSGLFLSLATLVGLGLALNAGGVVWGFVAVTAVPWFSALIAWVGWSMPRMDRLGRLVLMSLATSAAVIAYVLFGRRRGAWGPAERGRSLDGQEVAE